MSPPSRTTAALLLGAALLFPRLRRSLLLGTLLLGLLGSDLAHAIPPPPDPPSPSAREDEMTAEVAGHFNEGKHLYNRARHAEAEAEFREMLAGGLKTLGEQHPVTLRAYYWLAVVLQKQHKIGAAREFARKAWEGGRQALGEKDPERKTYDRLWQDLKLVEEPKEQK